MHTSSSPISRHARYSIAGIIVELAEDIRQLKELLETEGRLFFSKFKNQATIFRQDFCPWSGQGPGQLGGF